tara:strand:- start:3274 stop:3738 length:465 start_codon:yes stop_codon:yes gene_type:complete
MKLDIIDRKILNELQKQGREPASNIAERIDVSVPTVTERIRKLQDGGIIEGFQAVIDPKTIGLDVAAIITIISDSSQHYKDVTIEAKSTPEVVQCFSTTGNGSHTLIVNTKNSNTLEELLRKVQSWPGVIRTETQIILSSYKSGMLIPISDDKS